MSQISVPVPPIGPLGGRGRSATCCHASEAPQRLHGGRVAPATKGALATRVHAGHVASKTAEEGAWLPEAKGMGAGHGIAPRACVR